MFSSHYTCKLIATLSSIEEAGGMNCPEAITKLEL
jgi:hypothetical protein